MLVDEAHRTTGGDLGNYLMGALPNATYLGFTGTPIDRTAYGKGTFKVFGADDRRATSTSTRSGSRSRTARRSRSTTRWPRTTCGWTGRRWRRSSWTWPSGGRQRHRGTEQDPGAGRHAQEHAEEPGPGGEGRPVRRRALPQHRRADGLQGVPRGRGPGGVRPLQAGPGQAPAAGMVRRWSSAAAARRTATS